jgi:hypothetical protein
VLARAAYIFPCTSVLNIHSYTNNLIRQIVGDFSDKTQSREEKDQENANLIRQALSKLHESVKEKVNRSELKVLRETLEKTRNMEVPAVCNHFPIFALTSTR